MIKVGINRDEELNRFKIYETFDEARQDCYPTATVVEAVNSYHGNKLGYIVMDQCEVDFRRIGK